MGKTPITGKPKKPTGLGAPSLSGTTVSRKWKVKSGTFKSSSKSRGEWFTGRWTFDYDIDTHEADDSKKKLGRSKAENTPLTVTQKGVKYKKKNVGPKTQTGQRTVIVQRIKTSSRSHAQKFKREAYYPFKRSTNGGYRFLKQVKFDIATGNRKGSSGYTTGKWLHVLLPDKPKIADVSLDSATGTWSCSITAAGNASGTNSSGAWVKERRDTVWWVTRQDTINTKYKSDAPYIHRQDQQGKDVAYKGTTTNAKIDLSHDISELNSLGYSDYIKVVVHAYSRGLRGKSGEQTKTRYFSYPAQPVINQIITRMDGPADGGGSPSGQIVIALSTNNSTTHPVDTVRLEVLKNSQITDPTQAFLANGWTEVTGAVDDAQCTALADTFANSYPQSGRKVWYRIKATHDHFIRYSTPVRAVALEHGPGEASFLDAIVVDDGANPTGIKLLLGFNDRSDGTSIEWSERKNAANSNEPPSTADQPLVSSKETTEARNAAYETTFKYSTVFYLTGLENGVKYYLSARRYELVDGSPSYGPRTYWKTRQDIQPVMFASKPTDVIMNVPAYIEETSTGFEVSWSFGSSVKQSAYELYYVKANRDEHGAIIFKTDPSGRQVAEAVETILKTGNTSAMTVSLTADEAKKAIENNRIVLRVAVSCGGPYAKSSNAVISVIRKPSVAISIADSAPNGIVTAQNPSLSYQVDQTGTVLLVRVISDGNVTTHPDGDFDQDSGVVLYTGAIEVQDTDQHSIELPQMPLEDGGDYTISVVPVHKLSKLRGEEVRVRFSVDWAHQAHEPGDQCYILGDHVGMTAEIHTAKPDNYDEKPGDVCDIYRVTPDGVYLIAYGLEFGQVVVDRFAPFSKRALLRYRIVTRTADGDMAWRDVMYNIDGYALRFDWVSSRAGDNVAYRSITLPYNLKFSDSWTKQFEAVRDLSGGKTGWWNPGVDRKATLSTDVVRIGEHSDPELKEGIRALAQHAGPVFVRTPNGCAFTANVNVSGFPDDYDSLVSNVSFDAEEIDLVPAFEIQNSD